MQHDLTMVRTAPNNGSAEPLAVTELHLVEGKQHGKQLLPVCPRCSVPLGQDCPGQCPHCGQRLNWHKLCRATVLFVR